MPLQARAQVVRGLPDLIPRVRGMTGFVEVARALQQGERASIDGAWGSSCALLAAALAQLSPGPLVVVLPGIRDVDDFAADLDSLADQTPLVFPAWETLPDEHNVADAIFGGRLRVLAEIDRTIPAGQAPHRPPGKQPGKSPPQVGDRLFADENQPRGAGPLVIVTSLPALLQPVPSRIDRQRGTRQLKIGGDINLDSFLNWLIERGFERTSAVEAPGEFAVHGGIIDVFPPDAIDPLRIELFGDEIESLRRFSVETQRTLEQLDAVALTIVAPVNPAGETAGDRQATGGGAHVLDELPADAWMLLSEPSDLVVEGRHYLERLRDPRGMFSVESTMTRCLNRAAVTVAALSDGRERTHVHFGAETIERFSGPKSEVLSELGTVVDRDETVLIACHNEGERERLSELLAQSNLDLADRVQLCVGTVTRGYRLPGLRLIVLSDHELFSRTEVRRSQRGPQGAAPGRVQSRAIDTFLDLNVGDLVVHLTHGIARYRGMELLEREDRREEHLLLEFRDKMKMYVPVSLIHLVQKYIGGAKTVPNLSKLGGSGWEAKKKRVSEAVADMASDMLRLQAAREAMPGFACPEDSHWQQEFEAAFPYVETADQAAAIRECKQDLERTRPMDRLICGDVGFGKTEVAMRAAFKMIDAGKQVAVLVPTTVLAEQHYRTFSDRMAEYPITIETLSRFRTRAEQQETLARMEAGSVDLVIGTHRLVQKDVRFRDLGLLIIDEEQRFGVEAKEMLKRARLTVDVLTMTATPIPRTLHLSLLGVRDISNLTTPPQDRVSIQTRSCRWDGELIRAAIVRELNRGGQCYFVHNRVYNIQSITDRLQSLVPEATFAIVHGQMPDWQIEENMLAFVAGQVDVLVATTIIESGLDIPNANTIFIHQADRYGLADLHQLRGRVGRYKNRAWCYLVLEEGRSITRAATKRLKAIEEYSELGAGFKIAMRDLEIRGAGNILGTEQSGHIAAVGYELYCQLLENAVRGLKNLPPRRRPHVNIDLPVAAYIPDSFVPPGRQKIEVYRRISGTVNLAELEDVVQEIRDRFGPPPAEVERLISLRELQILADAWGIDTIRREERFTVFDYVDAQKIHRLAARLGRDLRIADRRNAYLVMHREMNGDELLDHLRVVLR